MLSLSLQNTYPTTPTGANPKDAAKTLISQYAPDAATLATEWEVVPQTSVAAGFGIPLGAGKIYDTDAGVLSRLCAAHPVRQPASKQRARVKDDRSTAMSCPSPLMSPA